MGLPWWNYCLYKKRKKDLSPRACTKERLREDTAGRQQSASQDHTLDTEWAGRHFDLGLLTSG